MAIRTALEEAASFYSDAHKDAYGHRPYQGGVYNPQTLEEYDAANDELCKMIGEQEREEDRNAAFSLLQWESQLAAMQALGAADRATAIRWHIAALGYEGNFETHDCQEVESALYGTYPIRVWGILLSEVWPAYTMCGVRTEYGPDKLEELATLYATRKAQFMTGFRPA